MGRNKTNIVRFIIEPQDINIQKHSPVMNIHVSFPEIVINSWRYKEAIADYHMFLDHGKIIITDNNSKMIAETGVELFSISDSISSKREYEKSEQRKVLYSLIKSIILGTFARFTYKVTLKKGYEGITIDPYYETKKDGPDIFDKFTEEVIRFIDSEEV